MFLVMREIWVQVTSVQNHRAKLVSSMETITTSLKATLSFLEKNKKLDATVYESIESTQVQQLLLQVKGIALSLEEAEKVTETLHLSKPERVSQECLVPGHFVQRFVYPCRERPPSQPKATVWLQELFDEAGQGIAVQ